MASATVLFGCLCGCSTLRHEVSLVMGGETTETRRPVSVQDAASLTEEQIERRVAFLTARLDAGRRHAARWQYGWLVVNAGGGVVASARAPFDGGNDLAYDVTEAVKSGIGVLYLLLNPMPGYRGAEPIRAMPDQTRDDKLAQLVQAEHTLHAAAIRSQLRSGWLLHLGNLALNLAGGAALLAIDAPGQAALSAGLDTLVGEAQLWSAPWRPSQDWEDYERFVTSGQASPTPSSAHWRIMPTTGGLAFAVKF